MDDRFFKQPIPNSPYEYPSRHWELDKSGQPTQNIFDRRRPDEEIETVAQQLKNWNSEGLKADEIGIFVRTMYELPRAISVIEAANLPYIVLDEMISSSSGKTSVSTMHLAKGLEFRAVVVMACDYEVIPLQEQIEKTAEISDLEDVYNTERHLLYVA